MSEHTPGPWEYSDRSYWVDGKMYKVGDWAIMAGSYCLAQVAKEVDARLIASAPEMAAEIERVKAELIKRTVERDDERNDTLDHLRTAGAVIELLKEQNAAMLRALKVALPWASKAVADLEDNVIGKRALDFAWEAIAKVEGGEAEPQ